MIGSAPPDFYCQHRLAQMGVCLPGLYRAVVLAMGEHGASADLLTQSGRAFVALRGRFIISTCVLRLGTAVEDQDHVGAGEPGREVAEDCHGAEGAETAFAELARQAARTRLSHSHVLLALLCATSGVPSSLLKCIDTSLRQICDYVA